MHIHMIPARFNAVVKNSTAMHLHCLSDDVDVDHGGGLLLFGIYCNNATYICTIEMRMDINIVYNVEHIVEGNDKLFIWLSESIFMFPICVE